MANIFYQITSSIKAGFGNNDNGGIDKKSLKSEDFFSTKDHVLSYNERDRLIDVAADFSKWLKAEHSDIKLVEQLNPAVAKEYLLSKHKWNGGTCNSNSVNALEQALDKIAHLCSKKFGRNIHMAVNHKELPQDGEKKRSLVMTKEIMGASMGTMRDGTQGKTCLELARELGLRACEFGKLRVSDFNFDNKKLHIHESKGGRSRDIGMTDKVMQIAKSWIEEKGLSRKDKLFTIRAGSVCDLMAEGLKRVGHTEFIENKTSIHAVRKMVANKMYVERIQKYLKERDEWEKAEKRALGDVAEFLGHGRQRTVEEYVDRFDSLNEFEAAGY